MVSFVDPGADPLFPDGPTLAHSALHITSSARPPSTPVDLKEQRLEDLGARLNCLTLKAEEILAQELRITQISLTVEVRALFKEYKLIGSMVRLERSVEKFLNAGDKDVVRPKGKLVFKPAPEQQLKDTRMSRVGEPAHHGKAFRHNYTSSDDKYEHPGPLNSGITPGGAQGLHPLRIIDPESISYVTTLPWDPVGTKLSWPVGLQWPRGLLPKINQILSIIDHECRVRLFHHICKYGPSPVLRVGIESQVQTHFSSIFEQRTHNYLGLTPETRIFLRGIFERKSKLNVAESRILARICRVGRETIDLLWEDLRVSRKPHMAMKVFITAREIEKNRRYIKREQEEVLIQQREKLFKNKEHLLQMAAEQQEEVKRYRLNPRAYFETRHDNGGPMSAGMSRGERLRVDPDLQKLPGGPFGP